MENVCNVNHLESDVLLPPRKRLLAGLKRQSSEGEDVSRPSLKSSSSPPASIAAASLFPSSSEFDIRLKNFLSSQENNSDLSPEQIVEASRSAAVAAAKAAEAARAAAEEKAVIAAKAIAAAKSALDLVASFSDAATSKDRCPKKNKLKKQLPVQLLYKRYQPIENNTRDEELARSLHRAINSSPRISKNPSSSDFKSHKHKKPKSSSSLDITGFSNGVILEQNHISQCNGHAVIDKAVFEDSIQEVNPCKEGKKDGISRYHNSTQMELDNGEAESRQPNENTAEDTYSMGKKRGRMKQKKSPSSIHTFKEKSHMKEEMIVKNFHLTEMNTENHPAGNNTPLLAAEPSSQSTTLIEVAQMWKCQELKASTCIKQNKGVQS